MSTKWIGMVCRINAMPKLAEHTYTWIFRVLVMNLELAKHHHQIVCYSPEDVDSTNQTVNGLILEGYEFKKITLPLPKVNYDYYFGSSNNSQKNGFLYEDFEPWALKNGYKIYPERSVRKIANDKFTAARLLSQCDKAMIPHTELFKKESAQLSYFLNKYPIVFIKPRFGSSGNGIFVLEKGKNKYYLDYYNQGKKITESYESLAEFLADLNDEKYDDYIIQQAVDCCRFENRVFDIRILMFKDDKTWHFLSELRLGAKGKEVSNASQGGESFITETILEKIFPKRVSHILAKIRTSSEKLATFLNDQIDDKIAEIALDILIDTHEDIHIAEINIKPGLCGGFTLYDNFFNMSEQETLIYDTLAKKHGEYLAKSLLYRGRE